MTWLLPLKNVAVGEKVPPILIEPYSQTVLTVMELPGGVVIAPAIIRNMLPFTESGPLTMRFPLIYVVLSNVTVVGFEISRWLKYDDCPVVPGLSKCTFCGERPLRITFSVPLGEKSFQLLPV